MRKQLGWKAPLWGFFFGTLPDLDVLISPLLDPIAQLSWHRGISHSILICFLATPLFGFLLSKLHRQKGITFPQASWFVFLTWSTHVLIDCFTTYGTQIYEPFSNTRASLNNMSIIDFSFTLPMLLAFLLIYRLKLDKNSNTRTWIGRCTMLWLCFYASLSFYFKHLATSHFQKQLAQEGIEASRLTTAPTLTNIFLWRMLAESDGKYYISYWSIFDDQDETSPIDIIPNGHEHIGLFKNSKEVQKLIWFSEGWHLVIKDDQDPDSLVIVDMRFGESRTAEQKTPVFAWKVTHDGNDYSFNNVSFRKGIKVAPSLRSLRNRIAGPSAEWDQGSWPWETKQP